MLTYLTYPLWSWLTWPFAQYPSFYGSWFNDYKVTSGRYDEIDMSFGDDHLIANGYVSRIDMGAGHDKVTLKAGAGTVWLGSGNDRIETDRHVDQIHGGSGHDELVFRTKVTNLDISFDSEGTVQLSDKLTGETTRVTGVEQFTFNDQSYSVQTLRAEFSQAAPKVTVANGTGQGYVNDADPSVNVIWQRALHEAIVDSNVTAGPTIAARAMAMVHTAIYDAFASFDARAVRVAKDAEGNNGQFEGKLSATDANLTKAMSFAAYTVLVDLYPDQKSSFDQIMTERYGFSPAGDNSLAARLGIDAGQDVLAARATDGSNQAGNYASTINYTPVNKDGDTIVDMDRWTPENVPNLSADQMFLTPHWGKVAGFAIPKNAGGNDFTLLTPPEPKHFLMEAYKGSVLNMKTGTLKLSADAVIDGVSYTAGQSVKISKAMIGNVINPEFIAQAEEVVNISANLTTRQKVIAEFWEDGSGTSFPPGTAMFLAEYVSARDNTSLIKDAKTFMVMANAQLDASIAAWNAKLEFDYARPVRVIKALGELGLIGEQGVDEITGETGHVIRAWAGINPTTGEAYGVRTILAENFVTYQQPGSDPSPPFAEYVSGHSTFSAAGATVMRLMTGSDHFGASVKIAPNASRFEPGVPHEAVTLHWSTFTDTAQESGISRLYGGIHFMDGNVNGLALGNTIAQNAYDLAQQYFDGSVDTLAFV